MDRILIADGNNVGCETLIGDRISLRPDLIVGTDHDRRVAVLYQQGSDEVADTLQARLVADNHQVSSYLLPDRDAAKTLSVAEDCYLWLNREGLNRNDLLVTVGGGAATDLGGFVGATYLRGIETVLVPTTMLAAVDAAIGGKSAVNVGGKNLVGVFRLPSRVLVDVEILRNLPHNLLVEGTAEAVKAGFIADPVLIELYEQHGLDAPLEEVLTRAITVKAEAVSNDFQESGRRMFLNYGHTVGHAIEYVTGIAHGHAVSIGMVAAGAVSSMYGFVEQDRQVQVLQSLELPVKSPPADRSMVLAALALDKKRNSEGLRMVVLAGLGDPRLVSVDDATLHVALDAVGVGS